MAKVTLKGSERTALHDARAVAPADPAERLEVSLTPGPHKFDLPMQAQAFAWVQKWIR